MAVQSSDTPDLDTGPSRASDATSNSDAAELPFTAGVAEPDQETASPLSGALRHSTAPASPARPSSSFSAPQTDPDLPICASNASCANNRTSMIGDATCGVMVQNTQGASCPTTKAELPSPKQCDLRLSSPHQKEQSSRRESMPCPDAVTYKGGESEVEPAAGKLKLRRKRKAVDRPSHSPYGASLDNDSDGDSYGNPRDDSDDEKDYQPPIEGGEGEQDKEEDDNDVRPTPRKRSKIDSPTHATLNSTFAQRLRPRGHISQTRKFQTPARGRGRPRRQTIPSPPSSTSHDDQGSAEPAFAKFEEWPLENACLKRVTENGVTTFQLQFSWDSCTKNGHETRNRRNPAKSRNSAKHTPVTKVAFTAEEDNLLIELKRQELSWQETYEQFTEKFPGRSKGTLQVRYCTKLKGRCANKVGSP